MLGGVRSTGICTAIVWRLTASGRRPARPVISKLMAHAGHTAPPPCPARHSPLRAFPLRGAGAPSDCAPRTAVRSRSTQRSPDRRYRRQPRGSVELPPAPVQPRRERREDRGEQHGGGQHPQHLPGRRGAVHQSAGRDHEVTDRVGGSATSSSRSRRRHRRGYASAGGHDCQPNGSDPRTASVNVPGTPAKPTGERRRTDERPAADDRRVSRRGSGA